VPRTALRTHHVLLPLLALVSVGTPPACKRETPEAAVRRVIDDACAALQERDVARAVRHLSRDYKDKLSRTNQQMRGLAFWVLRRGPVTVFLRETKIQVDGETATVTTEAHTFLGHTEINRLGDLIPQGAQKFDLTIKFAREGGDWKVRALDGDWTNPDLAL
jgi:hypothetical protein